MAFYDSYNYPRYWQARSYEDQAEKQALKKLLKKVKPKNSVIDIGGGYGRLAPIYAPLFKTRLLIDPSQILLKKAKKELKNYSHFIFKLGKARALPAKNSQFDAAIMIRVSHHLPFLAKAISESYRVLKPGGFLVLEFANKVHFKSSLKALLKGKINYLLFHTPKNISHRKTLKFLNYHPSHIKTLLLTNHFKIIKILSVSNFRGSFFKKIVPLKLLLMIESLFQNLLAYFYFGPSIFILAQKK